MDGVGQTVALPDGRSRGYATYGDPGGIPAIYCHGFPGSRIEASPADGAAHACGIRVIAPDRTIGDWPADTRSCCRVCDAHFVPGEGHLSLIVRHHDDILAGLVAGTAEAG
jgi:pimeloyl-ACP methyl ester carboxylesterase